MKRFVMVVALLLVVVLVIFSLISAIKVINEFEADGTQDSETSGGTSNTDSVDTSDPVTFQMYAEPQLRLDSTYELPFGVRFRAMIPAELKREIDEDSNKSAKCVIAPLDYFDAVYDETASEMDWVAAFESSNQTFLDPELHFWEATDGEDIFYELRFSIEQVSYKNLNRKFTAIAYVETNDGSTVSRQYATFPEGESYATIARSVAYLCSYNLNLYSLGSFPFDVATADLLQQCQNNCVDQATGLSEPTDDGSVFDVTLSLDRESYEKGEEIKLIANITPSVELHVLWLSTDSSIVDVRDDGVLVAVGSGTVTIFAYVMGEKYTYDVTVQ